MKIGDLIEVPPVRTVIRLEEGRIKAEEIAASFVFTPEVFSHLTVIAEALITSNGQGYFLQGDFGSGKSHFLAALYAWLAAKEGRQVLAARHGGLKRAGEMEGRFLPVDISLINYRAADSLEKIILEMTEYSLRQQLPPGDGNKIELTPAPKRSDTFLSLVETVRSAGFTGVVLLIDELSEFFRSKPSPQALNEDARTLQLLGELSTGQPLWIVAAVQESIEQTGDIALSILRKIRDRFPVKLTLSTTHIRSLISGRLVHYLPGAEKEIYRIYEEYRRQFPAFSVPLETFRSSYPVHPVTLSLLEGLGALFSQHRGLVDFVYSRIAGDTRRDIPSILDRPANELLAPDSIYEHFAGRLAEFSDFNIYPRHIVPHLDKVIDGTLELEEDRTLARRLVRMLVLYHIHPTASEPSVSELAELSACSLDFQSADLSSRFVAETVLEPVASAGRFLARVQGELDNPGQAVYAIVSEDDPSKTMEARLRRVAEEIDPEDSRLLLEAFAHLRESESWPGKALLGEGLRRSITWSSSNRQVLVRFVHRNEDSGVADRLAQRLETEGIDCIVLLVLGQGAPDLEHTAVWQIPNPEDAQVLKEFLACALTLEELNVSNPAEAPLIPLVQERTRQLAPAACQAALEAFYAGRFADSRIRIDRAVLQLKHFGRLLEAAGESLLENRYPRFREVAPRRFNPSPRIYNQLLEEFIIPGSLTLSEARARALSAALDGLAVPLGLVEIRRGSYLFSPDTVGYPLLSFFFGCLSPSGDTAMEEILNRLERGLFGLPRDTALFLIASLAAGGLITVRRSGRALPLEYLNLNTMEKAEAVSLGELISERDQTTLKQECAFLAPAGGWESFGLRQQREAWKETLKLKDTGDRLIEDIRSKLARMEGFSSFQAFDVPAFHRTLERLGGSLQQIKVSYGAKEGLERFLSGWRGSGLTDRDVELLKRLNKFLSQSAEEFIFINRYLNHPVVEKAAALDSSLDGLRQALLKLLSNPEDKVVEDSGAHLAEAFGQFRDQYVLLYARQHDAYYRAFRRRPLSKNSSRALEVLSRLAVIEALDRPPGLEQYLQLLNAPNVQQCSRNLPEELIRSPVCMCGFKLGDVEEKKATDQDRNDPEKVEQAVDHFLQDYVSILQNPDILESVTAQAYALKDAEPETAASLKKIIQALKSGALNAPTLVNLIDGAAAGELDRALKGRLPIRKRDLSDLERTLAGRRLPPALVLKLVNEWLAGDEEPADGVIVAVERSAPASSAKAAELDWWPLLHENAAYGPLANTATAPAAVVETAAALKKLEERLQERFPSVELRENFFQMQPGALFRFIAREPFHFQAAREAWRVLAERILNGAHLAPEADMKSGSATAERAATVENALRLLQTIASGLTQSFPGRLALRLPLSRILTHPWATAELRSAAGKTLDETSALGEEWLSGLPPVAPIDLEIKPLVLVFDGASPDLWLEISDTLASFRPNNQAFQEEWARLEAVPETVDALIGLFGLEADPEESFYQRQVVYANLSGDEEHGLKNYVQSLAPDKAIVLRLSIVDRGAHSGKLHLSDMYEVMKNIIESELMGLLELCKKQKRDLVLTADHGLTLKNGRLTHGGGGPYERAIYRARFSPTDA